MANPEQLEILKQGVNVWNKWRSENPSLKNDNDIAGVDLSRADLRNVDLSRADLQEVNLERANLQGANLQEANLSGAILFRANLREAHLQRANLEGAILARANFQKADLREAHLWRAYLQGAYLQGACLQGADLREAHLQGASIQKNSLGGVNLEGANLEGVEYLGGNFGEGDIVVALSGEPELSKSELRVIEHWLAERREAKFKKAELKKREQFKISIAHPKLLSKRYSSVFLVQIYLPGLRQKVLQRLKTQFKNHETEEHIENSKLGTEQEARLHFSSPDITFSDDVIKKLDHEINSTNFMAKPNDTCEPGEHQVILSISDRETGLEYESIVFIVTVKDFAFDHVSRPLLSKVSSVVLGAGSLAMFILTLMGKIDTTFGLTSGTIGVAAAGFIQMQFYRLYQQQGSVHTP